MRIDVIHFDDDDLPSGTSVKLDCDKVEHLLAYKHLLQYRTGEGFIVKIVEGKPLVAETDGYISFSREFCNKTLKQDIWKSFWV